MQDAYTSQLFETQKKPVIVEMLTYSGSAFGVTPEGEQVFINSRIVDLFNLKEGTPMLGFLLPNYTDKRDVTPWRALRLEPLPETEVQGASTEAQAPSPAADRILVLINHEPDGYFTTVDLAEELDLDTKTVSNACMSLHQQGLIARADVHAAPNQKRASFVLWAKSSKSFAS